MFQRIVRGLELTLILFILALVTGYSSPSSTEKVEKVRVYTRQIEFNYLSWMGNAALIKLRSASIDAPHLFDHAAQKQIVTETMRLTQQILEKEYQLEQIYADAKVTDKELASESLRAELAGMTNRTCSARRGNLARTSERGTCGGWAYRCRSACAKCLVPLHASAHGADHFSA
jgi:hypothetical protein